MRDTIIKHGSIKTPSGLWIAESKRVLILNRWFVEEDYEDSFSLKKHVADWLFDNIDDFEFRGWGHLGAKLTFGTDAGALFFRMFWDDQVPS